MADTPKLTVGSAIGIMLQKNPKDLKATIKLLSDTFGHEQFRAFTARPITDLLTELTLDHIICIGLMAED